jgi:ADP-ribosylglycohydrolase
MSVVSSRALGVVQGLCAGDRNGGPQRMALRIMESLASTREGQSFSSEDVARRYHSWFQGGNNEPERAYDTGAVFSAVMRVFPTPSSRVPRSVESAGVNAGHRVAVLCIAPWLNDAMLIARAARDEAMITHCHTEAVETAAAVALICRHLVYEHRDDAATTPRQRLEDACTATRPLVHSELVTEALSSVDLTTDDLHMGGFAPKVLQTALFFLRTTNTFEDALCNSLQFAGPENYCPELVGSIGGAMYGAAATEPFLQHPHCNSKHLARVREAFTAVAAE